MKKSVVLIGYMGSGKSKTGRILSDKLGMTFFDSDDEIEKEEGRTITTIFEESGEDHFRALETEYLLHNEIDNCVLSVGGGLPCFNGNMERLNQIGVTIYLETSADELRDRLIKRRDKRPLLAKVSEDKLLRSIKTALSARDLYYSQAKYIIRTDSKTVNEVVSEIIELF